MLQLLGGWRWACMSKPSEVFLLSWLAYFGCWPKSPFALEPFLIPEMKLWLQNSGYQTPVTGKVMLPFRYCEKAACTDPPWGGHLSQQLHGWSVGEFLSVNLNLLLELQKEDFPIYSPSSVALKNSRKTIFCENACEVSDWCYYFIIQQLLHYEHTRCPFEPPKNRFAFKWTKKLHIYLFLTLSTSTVYTALLFLLVVFWTSWKVSASVFLFIFKQIEVSIFVMDSEE